MKKVLCALLMVSIAGMGFGDYLDDALEDAKAKEKQKSTLFTAGLVGVVVGGLVGLVGAAMGQEEGMLPMIAGTVVMSVGSLVMLSSIPTSQGVDRVEYVKTHAELTLREERAILEGKIFIGMSEAALIASWGRPNDINSSVGSWGVHKQYVYGTYSSYSSPRYVYVENGFVTSWQN